MSQPGIASFDQVDPQDIWRKDRDHFLHPWTHFDSFKKDGSLIMGRGEGAFVHDIAGKRYLDGIAGLWCVNMGYGREEIVAWAFERDNKGRSFGFTGAHFHKNWGDENFRRLVVNAILWSAHVDVPKGGAKVDLDPAELNKNLDRKGK